MPVPNTFLTSVYSLKLRTDAKSRPWMLQKSSADLKGIWWSVVL